MSEVFSPRLKVYQGLCKNACRIRPKGWAFFTLDPLAHPHVLCINHGEDLTNPDDVLSACGMHLASVMDPAHLCALSNTCKAISRSLAPAVCALRAERILALTVLAKCGCSFAKLSPTEEPRGTDNALVLQARIALRILR